MHKHVWVILLLFLAPAAARPDGLYNPTESTPTTMYIHLNDFQDAPINTQLPDDRYSQAKDLGLTQHSQGCVPNPTGTLLTGDHHTSYAFSSPGYVNYDVDDGGKPTYHNERGISFDVEMDGAVDPVFTWFLESQYTAGSFDPDPNMIPAIAPAVTVRATIREGDEVSVGSAAYNTGEAIAQGQSDPAYLLADATPENPHVEYIPHAGKHLYKFSFPLEYEKTTINREESFNVRIDVFMDNPVCNDVYTGQYLMPDFVRTHTSPMYRPQFTWNLFNPLVITMLHPQFIGDEMVIHAHVNSPWGNYDVAGDQGDSHGPPRLVIDGPSRPVNLGLLAHVIDHVGHHGHTEPVALAWSWTSVQENPAPGIYTVTMEATNDQGTAIAEAVASFELGEGGYPKGAVCGFTEEGQDCSDPASTGGVSQDSPGPLLLLPLLAALILRRR